jgi:two-component system invasion response regulator UvrY
MEYIPRKYKEIKIGIIDDHTVLRKGLAMLISDLPKTRKDKYCYKVTVNVGNGTELIKVLKKGSLPDVVLLDIHMPVMDGYETAEILKKDYPGIKVLAFTMYDDEIAADKMFKAGARGYLAKYADTETILKAVNTVFEGEIYLSDSLSKKLIRKIYHISNDHTNLRFSNKEIEFLQLCCTEMTYAEIAKKMKVSPRTVDNYRESLFEKIKVTSRVGLVLYAVLKELVSI